MFEIKVLYCAHSGCINSLYHAPGSLSMGSSLHIGTPSAQVLISVHPAAKMCTQGTECILNFEHCDIFSALEYVHVQILQIMLCAICAGHLATILPTITDMYNNNVGAFKYKVKSNFEQ